MTSKEALERINNLLVYYADIEYDIAKEKYKEEFEVIEKDLEVLEILKKRFVIEEFRDLPTVIYFNTIWEDKAITYENFKKLKEWLEND